MDVERIEEWRGQEVIDQAGEKLGKLDDLLLDLATGEPRLARVKSGLMGRKARLVPLEGASFARDAVRLAISKERFEAAPEAEDAARLDRRDEIATFEHYGLQAPEGSDGERYETSAAAAGRREEAAAERGQAEELEAAADRQAAEAQDAHRRAEEAQEAARTAEGEREDLLEQARQARERAERAERPLG